MESLSKEYVISFFNKNLRMHGDSSQSVRWTPDGQILHYECLLDIKDSIKGKKILDYGCGKGDFYKFLKDRKIPVNYTGFDINENLVAFARQKHPECSFRVFDIENDMLDEDFDYIFLCGVFNLKVQGLDQTIKNVLTRLFSHCRLALVFNALSAHNPVKDFELNYVYPEDIVEFISKNISPIVALRQDRIPYDFTIFIYKEISGIDLK